MLKKNDYEIIMSRMMEDKKFEKKKYLSNLFFDEKDLNKLSAYGHSIGLHSHTHPTSLENLSYNKHNIINSMSHPCGSYNGQTLEILKDLEIELGFRNVMNVKDKKINNSFLEIARQDHSEIIDRIK